jgi:hypothetical protein
MSRGHKKACADSQASQKRPSADQPSRLLPALLLGGWVGALPLMPGRLLVSASQAAPCGILEGFHLTVVAHSPSLVL